MPPMLYYTKDEIEYIRDLAESRCTNTYIREKGLVRTVFWNYARLILSGRRRWDKGVDGQAVRNFIVQLVNDDPDLARAWRPWLKEGQV